MSLAIRNSSGEMVEAVVSGKLTQADYQVVEREIARAQKPVRVLLELHDFNGWSLGGIWEEYKLSASSGTPVDRLAMVGPRMVNETHGAFDHPFVVNDVKYFDLEHVEEARTWLNSGQKGDGLKSDRSATSL